MKLIVITPKVTLHKVRIKRLVPICRFYVKPFITKYYKDYGITFFNAVNDDIITNVKDALWDIVPVSRATSGNYYHSGHLCIRKVAPHNWVLYRVQEQNVIIKLRIS